jgi:hypothetical protein
MHPATRKLLQDEVKRTLAPTPAPAPTGQNWRAWRWPLLILWGGIVAILMMFVMINRQISTLGPAIEKEEVKGQKDEKFDSLSRNSSPRRDYGGGRASRQMGSAVVSTAPAGVPPAAPVGVVLEPPALSSAAVAAPTAASPASFDALLSEKSQSALVMPAASVGSEPAAQNFVQVHASSREGTGASPPSNLLSNFLMTRSGQNVSIVDADGSIYNGQVLNSISRGGRFRGGAQARAKSLQDAYENTNWTFNVTGTNQSLKKTIIFTGNVLDMPLANTFTNTAVQYRNASRFQNASNAAQAPSTKNSRITGQVQVGGGKPFDIEAKPPVP